MAQGTLGPHESVIGNEYHDLVANGHPMILNYLKELLVRSIPLSFTLDYVNRSIDKIDVDIDSRNEAPFISFNILIISSSTLYISLG